MYSSISAKSTISSNSRAASLPDDALVREARVDVLPPGEVGMKSGSDLQQVADLAVNLDRSPAVG